MTRTSNFPPIKCWRGSIQWLGQIVLAVIAALAVSPAHASLTCQASDLNQTINSGTLSVPAHTAAGTVIKTLSSRFVMSCRVTSTSTTHDPVLILSTPSTPILGDDVYPTNITGLGIRFSFHPHSCTPGNAVMTNHSVILSCPLAARDDGFSQDYPVTTTVDFVATGTSPGAQTFELTTIPVISLSYQYMGGMTDSGLLGNLYTGAATGSLIRTGCSVFDDNITVSLPAISTSSLQSVGDTAGATPFKITLTCDSSIQISYQLDGTSPPDMAAGVLANRTDTDDSTGVGVQILESQSDTPITFGKRIVSVVSDTGSDASASQKKIVSIPLFARYYKTDSSLTPGKVSARATFTMNYQ